jgi:fluoroquinolone transport system ATP-binding protein
MEGLADNREFLDALRNPALTAVHSQEATLEDVFVEVTGRTLQ